MSRSFEIRREVRLDASPEEVWRAIATPEGQAGWFMTDPDASGEIVADEPHRFEVRAGTQVMEYLVEAADGGTAVLRFVHSGVLDDDWGDEFETLTGWGWDLYFRTLAEYLHHFPGRPAVYAEAEAPSTPDVVSRPRTSDAWKRILEALGDPGEGDTVSSPVGPGVVDIRTEGYLGIRTDNALVRFHERSLIGMSLAVGHHDYTLGADPEAITKTWTTWLAETTRS